MKLTVLGCGDAFASSGRFNTAFLIENDSQKILLDCGASTLIRLKQLGYQPDEIQHIIITHFHGDHYGGLPFLILSNHLEYQRRHPLFIFGPEGIRERAYQLQEALYPGTSRMLDELDIRWATYEEARWLPAETLEVYARTVTHAPPALPHGVKVRIGGQVIGFSGDTEWDDHLIDLSEGTDVFILECNFLKTKGPGHLSYDEIAEKLPLLRSGRILLTHMGTAVIAADDIELERLHDGQVIEI